MDTGIQNQTLNEYIKVRNQSVALFLLIIQALYLNPSLFLDFFKDKDLADYIMGLVISGSLFSAIYAVLFFIHQRLWISKYANTCYVSGIWYHVFDRRIDKDKDYVRAGWVRISQNFYDLNVEAYNYNVYVEDGHLKCDEQKRSHWYFSLSQLEENGSIKACFAKATKNVDLASNSGVMDLFLVRDDSGKCIDKMYGVFADSAPSTVTGNIKLFRYQPAKTNTNFKVIDCAPTEWKEYIADQLHQTLR